MSLEFAIHNVGEYFSAHYLAGRDGFSKDIAEHVKRWKEQGSQSTPRKLQALGDAFYAAKSEAMDYPEAELRSKADTKDIRAWHPQLLAALGYQAEPLAIILETEQKHLPALLRLHRHGQPWLAILQAPFCLNSGDYLEEALEEFVEPAVNNASSIENVPPLVTEWEKAIALLFKQEDRPRWAILLAGSKVYLFDAHTYAQGRYIYVDLDAAFSSKDKNAFEAIAALLAHECLAPVTESDEVLHEKLREGSLKSTHGVSEQLQNAVREAIELIANGWIEQRRAKSLGYRQLGEREAPLADGSREVTAEQLKHDALIYVYRILFCLYAEARGGELGVLPITDDIYRLGYSLEALRDLADMGEPGTQSEDGCYYAEHLNRLFQLVHEGFHPEQDELDESETANSWQINLPEQNELFGDQSKQLRLDKAGRKQLSTGNVKTFVIQPLTATLFAPDATPLLSRVLLSNRVLHQVIRRLSLGTGSSGRQIGRINYAELGILQLGSVYEGLLSYKGFFAKEDLIQVLQKPKKPNNKPQPVVLDNAIDPKIPTWFVPRSREAEFNTGEIVLENRDPKQSRIYKTGTFILHLNGVDRVNSASYYTPEVLTRCLISEALKERLKDFCPEQADEILKLTVCEPAMGSAAFLVEAIDQLSHHYLQLKQQQLGETIDPSQYEDELRRVRHYIAVHNVYGVDLNPTAVELGSLSLWLSTIHRLKIAEGNNGGADLYQPGATPWFGLRLRAGNSLIGARRAVWTEDQLITGAFYGKDAAAPRQLKPGENRQTREIYHFLVWDEDMTPAARDNLMRQYWSDECNTINAWRNKQVKRDWRPEDIARARDICKRIDVLWEDYAEHRMQGLKNTECTATVWPIPSDSVEASRPSPSLVSQENVKANLEAQSGAFQRLKLLMDSWCSFYFWPVQAHGLLPSREAWFAAAEVLLGCNSVQNESTRAMLDITLGEEIQLEALFQASQQQLPDAEKLADAVPWYGEARAIDREQHFHHWELIFTEVLGPKAEGAEPRGFDLMFGNPPWIGGDWKERYLLAEIEPLIDVREYDLPKIEQEKARIFSLLDSLEFYRDTFLQNISSNTFLSDRTLYPSLSGVRTNLYKNFIERSWCLLYENGVCGLLHPVKIFEDNKADSFRKEYYARLKKHYQFSNQLMWFPDIGHRNGFSVNIYSGGKSEIEFDAIFNLLHPKTIDECYRRDGFGHEIPAIRDSNGQWEFRGHPKRIVNFNRTSLSLIARILNYSGNDCSSPLVKLHAESLIDVISKFFEADLHLADIEGEYYSTDLFNETNATRSGVIIRNTNPTSSPNAISDLIFSGPHYFAGNFYNKCPRSICKEKSDYDAIDLEAIPEDYIQRSVFSPNREGGYEQSIPIWPKPHIPGFWPVSVSEVSIYEKLFGEEVKLYYSDADKYGFENLQGYVYISEIEGDIKDIYSETKRNSVSIKQSVPDEKEIKNLPRPITCYVRYANRRRAQSANERTLIPVLLPRGPAHVYHTFSVCFVSPFYPVLLSGAWSSILFDFFIKTSGKEDIVKSTLQSLPIPTSFTSHLLSRALRLYCLTSYYSDIWEELFGSIPIEDSFCSKNPRLEMTTKWSELNAEWDVRCGLRFDYARRQAQIEIDVLVALWLGVSLDELILIYDIQFPVLNSYERADIYDIHGRRLPNSTRKEAGASELREALINHDGISPVTISWEIDNGNQAVTKTFYPPFNHVDRIEDYKAAYRVFSERLGLTQEQHYGS